MILNQKIQKQVSQEEELEESDLEEDIEVDEVDAMDDLESNPSGSVGQSKVGESGDFDLKVDQITDDLLN